MGEGDGKIPESEIPKSQKSKIRSSNDIVRDQAWGEGRGRRYNSIFQAQGIIRHPPSLPPSTPPRAGWGGGARGGVGGEGGREGGELYPGPEILN